MRKNITNHRHLALAVTMAALLALTGCDSAVETDNTAPETEAVFESTESIESTEAIEAFVPEKELESTEAETVESESTESELESTEVNETEATVVESETTVIESEASPKAETISYTFTDMNTTMYAKSSVNVRNLPSVDGSRLGSLTQNQAVTVTGQCNETGWYRITYNNGEAYVSNKYLSDNAVAESASTNTAGGNTNANTSTSASTDQAVAAAIAQFGPNIVIFDDGTIFDPTTWQQLGTINEITGTTTTVENGFDRTAAEAIWSYVNAERTAAGLNELAWDENIYNFACQRAQAIVNDFSHNGHGSYGENILQGCADDDSYMIHMLWHNSTGHYNNYMHSPYVSGACAVFRYNGSTYAVENFAIGSSGNSTTTTREVNGQSVTVTQAEAAAIDAGNIWTASNGVVIYITGDGSASAGDGIHSLEELQAAMNEYYSCN